MLNNSASASKLISEALTPLAAEDRLGRLLELIDAVSPDVLWPAVLEWLPRCENIRPLKATLLRRLRKAGSAEEWLSYGEREAFDGIAGRQQVFRGCPSAYKAGIAWSLTYSAASWFARQHPASGCRSHIYEALIPKHAVFAVIGDENDRFTVLLDPAKLHDVQRVNVPPTRNDYRLSFAPNAEYHNDNDDGKTAELKLDAPMSWAPSDVAMPSITNMSDNNLKAMLAYKREQLHRVRLYRKEVEIISDIRRAEKELAARAQGARAGRVIEKQKAKGKSTGRPKKQSGPSNDNPAGAAEAA